MYVQCTSTNQCRHIIFYRKRTESYLVHDYQLINHNFVEEDRKISLPDGVSELSGVWQTIVRIDLIYPMTSVFLIKLFQHAEKYIHKHIHVKKLEY